MSLGSEGSCTIGGNLATNAGGTAVLRYGMTRELALGLEVVLPDGRVWDGLRGLRKDNTGYSLKDVFIGSEGTLGIITAAVLRLFPPTPGSGDGVGLCRRRGGRRDPSGSRCSPHAGAHLATFEIVNRTALDLVLTHLPGSHDPAPGAGWAVLVELAGTADLDAPLEAALTEAVEGGLVEDAAVAGSPAQRTALWALRENISEAQKVEGATLKHDVTLPIGDLAAWTDRIAPALEAILPGVRLVTYGHVGDGNLHFNLSAPLVAGRATTTPCAPQPATSRRRSTTPWPPPPGRSVPSTASARPRRRQRRRTSRRWRST